MMDVLRFDAKNIEWVFDGVSEDTIRLSVGDNQLLQITYEAGKFTIRCLPDEKLNIRPIAGNEVKITLSR